MVNDRSSWPNGRFEYVPLKKSMDCGEDETLWQYVVTIKMRAPSFTDSVVEYHSPVTRCTPKDHTAAPNCPAGKFHMANGQVWDSACSQDAGINNCECCYKGNLVERNYYWDDGKFNEGSEPLFECK